MISQDGLGLDFIGSMAVSPDGSRVYLGLRESPDTSRMNLAVLTLNASGQPVGLPSLYADSSLSLPFGDHANVDRMVVDSAHHKLYLLSNLVVQYAARGLSAGASEAGDLTVYDLDSNWDPLGAPQSVVVPASSNEALGLALDPQANNLYVVAPSDPNVYVYNVSSQPGASLPPPQAYAVSNIGAFDVAVSADGAHLYLDSPPLVNGAYQPSIEVVDLAGGVPQVNSTRFYPVPNAYAYFDFTCTAQAIYWRQDYPYRLLAPPYVAQPPQDRPLLMWQLDQNGNPVATGPVQTQFSASAFGVDPGRATLWVASDDTFNDAFTSASVVDGAKILTVPLDSSGSPTGLGTISVVSYEQGSLLMTVADDGSPVALIQGISVSRNQVQDYWLRVTVQQAVTSGGSPLTSTPIWLASPTGGLAYAANPAAIGQPVDVPLDDFFGSQRNPILILKDVAGPQPIYVGAGIFASTTNTLSSLTMQVDVWQGNPNAGGTLLNSLTETVQGENVAILVPGYGFEPPAERLGQIQTISQHAQEYLTAAQQVAIAPQNRPQQFVIGAGSLVGGEPEAQLLQTEASALSQLGINTVQAELWRGFSGQTGLDPVSQINPILDSNGLARRELALNSPGYQSFSLPGIQYLPALFDFTLNLPDPTTPTQSILDTWVAAAVTEANAEGADPSAVVEIHMEDEPGWTYPLILNEVKASTGWLQAFRNYLQATGYTPAFFGSEATDWSSVNDLFPIGAGDLTLDTSGVPTPASRHLFYWTARYFTDSCAQGFLLEREALQAVFPNLRTVYANWGGQFSPSVWYDNLNSTLPVQPNDSAQGSPDWLGSSRLGAASPWTEDGFLPDQQAEQESMTGAILRSASMLTWQATGGANFDPNNPGNFPSEAWQNFGLSFTGAKIGGFPSGASYKILSLLGQGAKSFDLSVFGPAVLAPANPFWSDLTNMYGPLAQALGLVGRAEPVLYPGRPARGNVAILLPSTSYLWDPVGGHTFYQQEIQGLDYALLHAGYTVDFVDDADLANGALTSRGYSVLYLTGPNLAAASQQQVANWVTAGGTLVVTPGAATADEYNTPTDILDPVLGLQPRQAVRDLTSDVSGTDAITLATDSTAAVFGSGTINLYGTGYPVVPSTTGGATIEGTLSSGGAGITANHFGAGTAIAYGFFPGWQYLQSPSESLVGNTDLPTLPRRWGRAQRHMADAPAVLANTPQPVSLSQQVVEADRLQSDKGIAITLLNWTDQPIASLTVTVPNVGPFTTVCTANGVPVQTQLNGNTMQITLPLDHVDVLLLQDAGAKCTIDGTMGDDQFVITPTGVQLNGQTVVSGPYGSLTLNGLRGNDTFTVLGTPAGSQVTLNGGAGNKTINVGSSINTLDPIQGAVTVDGAGGNSTLNVYDQDTSSPETYQLFGTQLLRYPSPPAGQPLGNPTQTINYFNINHVYVHGGTASDSWFVNSTLPGTTTDLYSAGGTISAPNYFFVFNSAQVLDGIQGPLALHGGGAYDFAEANDYLNAVGHTYTMTTGRLQRNGMANLTYDGFGEFILATANNPFIGHTPSTINVQTLSPISVVMEVATGDTVTVGQNGTLASIFANLFIEAGGLTRAQGLARQVTLDDSTDPNPHMIDLQSASPTEYVVSGLANASQGLGKIYFQLDPTVPVSILGGPADDDFRIHDFTGAPTLSIVAEPATSTRTNKHNKLDYSGYTGTVQVILPKGIATGFAGISGIEDVTAGIGNSLLVGDANPNILIGGTGRNILIGGGGGDTLDASRSQGDNILIGGYTNWDQNVAALEAIMMEWLRTDLTFRQRLSFIQNGGDPNEPYLLNNTTVFDDGSPDVLTGGAGRNWFFVHRRNDVITNFKNGSDHITPI
jgi:hypothetical protein